MGRTISGTEMTPLPLAALTGNVNVCENDPDFLGKLNSYWKVVFTLEMRLELCNLSISVLRFETPVSRRSHKSHLLERNSNFSNQNWVPISRLCKCLPNFPRTILALGKSITLINPRPSGRGLQNSRW